MIRRLALSTSLLLSLTACHDNAPGSPSTPAVTSFAGTWTGDLALQTTATRMTWTLSQSGTTVTGPVIVTLPSGIVLMNGALTGTVASSTLTYTIAVAAGGIPSQPACSGQLGGTVSQSSGTSPVTLSGSYAVASSTCATPFSSGSFTLARQ